MLPGPELLRRSDGRTWCEILDPLVRDTALVSPDTELGLDWIDRAVALLLSEFARVPMPQLIIQLGPQDASKADPTAFASLLAGLRGERLTQCVELSGAALKNLELGSLQVSAIAARALLELAVATMDGQDEVLELWRSARGDRRAVKGAASDFTSPPWSLLWTTRFGTRLEPELGFGWPKAINIASRLNRLIKAAGAGGRTLEETYNWLCEATHPNVEAQGVFWRMASPDRLGRSRVRFEPTASQSPVKAAIVNALSVSIPVLEHHARVLWWMAVDVVTASPPERNADIRALGLPAVRARAESCICGSGELGTECQHPEPVRYSARNAGPKQETGYGVNTDSGRAGWDR